MENIKWLWGVMDKRYHKWHILGLIISAVTSLMLLINPYLTMRLMDDVIVAQNPEPLVGLLLAMLLVKVTREGLRYLMVVLLEHSSQNTLMNLRMRLFTRLQYQDMRFFDIHRTGDLMTRLTGDLDTDVSELPEAEKTALAARLHARIEQLRTQPPQPVLLEKDGRPWDFTCLPVTQYGDFVRQEAFDSFSRLLDRFYAARDRADAIRQSSQVIRKTVSNLQARTARKLENQRKELAATHDRERLRRLGDILTANLYAVKRGQTKLCAADFYDPEMKEIEIPLNPAISPQQNAAKFYKDYQKAKTAEKVLTEQIARGEQELAYLASVLDALTRAESVRDLQEIRAELISGGYLRQTDRKKQMKLPPSRPMRFVSSDGFGIWVGRSNRQNDELTTKLAAKTDLWLHVQKIPGSHVIIETGGQTPPDRTVTEAMQLAAYYSQARAGQNVPVDYTPVKYVKKPAGARPGMVIYTTYQTAVVTPDAALCEALKEKN